MPTEVLRYAAFTSGGRGGNPAGVVLDAQGLDEHAMQSIAADLGYVTNLDMTFGRRYEHEGERRSFLSAGCAAPPGIPAGIFTLARGSFSFDNGQRISLALARNCWVR